MNIFPKDKLENIKSAIKKALDEGANPIAAFDADGTLWPGDMGEVLLHYQIKHKLLPNLPENPYQYYLDYKKRDVKKALLWLAQINQGLPIEQVRAWSSQALKELTDFTIFEHQKELISFMQSLGIKVYIVTASIKWAVEPGAPLHNIPIENVIGVQSKISNDIVGTDQEGPITYREGKVEALMLNTGDKAPLFTSGNTEGDLFLLQAASHVRLVIASAKPDEGNYETEKNMLKLAEESEWFFHDFNG